MMLMGYTYVCPILNIIPVFFHTCSERYSSYLMLYYAQAFPDRIKHLFHSLCVKYLAICLLGFLFGGGGGGRTGTFQYPQPYCFSRMQTFLPLKETDGVTMNMLLFVCM